MNLQTLPDEIKELVQAIASNDGEVRYKAWQGAGAKGAKAILPLTELAGSTDKGVAIAAIGAIEKIVHYAGRPGYRAQAKAVTSELLKAAASSKQKKVRADLIDLAGYIADPSSASALVKMLSDKDVREEARMALERIPGAAVTNAITKAINTYPDYKSQLQLTLHNRTLTNKTAGLKAVEMRATRSKG